MRRIVGGVCFFVGFGFGVWAVGGEGGLIGECDDGLFLKQGWELECLKGNEVTIILHRSCEMIVFQSETEGLP